MTTEQEITELRKQLENARNIISEVKDYLEHGGWLGQDAGLIWECKEFLEGKVSQ